jgi:thiamine-monophosphate kinase
MKARRSGGEGKKGAHLGEFELIEKILVDWQAGSQVIIGPGDDASAIAWPDADQLILQTTDMLVEGVDFRREWISPRQLGQRALNVNLSDIAAMGGRPLYSHLSLAIPHNWAQEHILSLTRGFCQAAIPFNVTLLGGDLSATEGPLAISVTVTGAVAKAKVIRRSGAKSGDVIWVSGALGEAAGGLKQLQEGGGTKVSSKLLKAFLDPQPEIELGLLCAESGSVNALIDLSDGLTGDLGHILKASKVGAVINMESLPVSRSLRQSAQKRRWDLMSMVLTGGEDFHLLGCSPSTKLEALFRLVKDRLKRNLTAIGQISKTPGLRIRRLDGSEKLIEARSHDHFI